MKSKQNKAVVRFLLEASGRLSWAVLGYTLVQMLLGVSGVLLALGLKEFVNAALDGSSRLFAWSGGKILLLIFGQLTLYLLQRFLREFIRARMENRLKGRLFRSLLQGSFEKVTKVHSAQWMNLLVSDTALVSERLTDLLPDFARMTVQLCGAAMALMMLEPRLVWLLVPGGLALLVFSTLFRKHMKQLHRKIREEDGTVRTALQESLNGMTVLRSYAVEQQIFRQTETCMDAHRKARMCRSNFSNLCNFGFGFLMRGVYLLAVGYCGYGILMGRLGAGSLVAVMGLVSELQGPMANISSLVPQYFGLMTSGERLLEAEELVRVRESSMDSADRARAFYEQNFQALVFDRVSFSYDDGCPVLDQLSLTIQKNSCTAFTGPSGGGKSTILRLALGLYASREGSCLLTDREGGSHSPQKLRRVFSYVPQGKFFMAGSIRKIVSFADPQQISQDERIWQALRIACAEDFVRKLDRGLDTVLGEQGHGLSEGQLQRLSIARAVFSERPILLLDEATSALDSRTEREILENLKAMHDRTVLIVTHRPAALAICDQVIRVGEEKQNGTTGNL